MGLRSECRDRNLSFLCVDDEVLGARSDGKPSRSSQAIAPLLCSTEAELRAESLGVGIPTGMSATAVVASKPKTPWHPMNEAFRRCAEGVSNGRFMANCGRSALNGCRKDFLHMTHLSRVLDGSSTDQVALTIVAASVLPQWISTAQGSVQRGARTIGACNRIPDYRTWPS